MSNNSHSSELDGLRLQLATVIVNNRIGRGGIVIDEDIDRIIAMIEPTIAAHDATLQEQIMALLEDAPPGPGEYFTDREIVERKAQLRQSINEIFGGMK